MSKIDLEELERLATEAKKPRLGRFIIEESIKSMTLRRDCFDFAKAASPSTVLKLIECVKLMREILKKYSDHENDYSCVLAQEALAAVDKILE